MSTKLILIHWGLSLPLHFHVTETSLAGASKYPVILSQKETPKLLQNIHVFVTVEELDTYFSLSCLVDVQHGIFQTPGTNPNA